MDETITRAEYDEYRRRMQDHNSRQDKRLELLEESVRQIGALTVSVEKLAQSIQSMVKEQERQGERLATLEGRDGEKWRKATAYIGTLIAGAILGAAFMNLGL